jgi:hypothetical protein
MRPTERLGGARAWFWNYQANHVTSSCNKISPIRDWELTDSKDAVVLRVIGEHFQGAATTRVVMQGVGGWMLPVRGWGKSAVMHAVQEGGSNRPLISYRMRRWIPNWRGSWVGMPFENGIEVVVHPEALFIPGIELVVAVTSHLLRRYHLVRVTPS